MPQRVPMNVLANRVIEGLEVTEPQLRIPAVLALTEASQKVETLIDHTERFGPLFKSRPGLETVADSMIVKVVESLFGHAQTSFLVKTALLRFLVEAAMQHPKWRGSNQIGLRLTTPWSEAPEAGVFLVSAEKVAISDGSTKSLHSVDWLWLELCRTDRQLKEVIRNLLWGIFEGAKP